MKTKKKRSPESLRSSLKKMGMRVKKRARKFNQPVAVFIDGVVQFIDVNGKSVKKAR